MKLKLFLIGFVFFQIAAFNLKGQIVFTKNDSINLQQDSLVLKVSNHYGNVFWQYSKESENWINLPGETKDSLLFLSIDSSGYYRAKIVDGTCEPAYSDTTYVLRALTDSMIHAILNQTGETANDIAFLNSGNQNSTFTILDSTAINPIIQIVTTELPDTIKPGWLILDTTGVGRLILVTDYTIEKSGNDFITKIIDGIQVGIDFLITDQELSYSSPSNRTKQEWNSPLKLSNAGKFKDNISYTLEDGSQSVTVNNSKDLLSLNFSKKELWNFDTGTSNMRFWLESGSISIKPALDFYAKYVPTIVASKLLYSLFLDSPFLRLPEYTPKGSLTDLKLITYTDFDIDLKFKIEASVHEDINDFIKPVKIIEYFYSIPAGPVFVTVKTELFARLIFEATGEISVNPELEWNNNIVLGVEGHKIGNQFEREFISSYSDKKSATTSVEGNFNLRERIEIVPKIEVYIMGLTGLKIETIPFQEFTFNASFSDNSPLLYDYSFDLGIDAQASFDISAFHWDNLSLAIYKKNLEILTKKNILSAPYNLEYISGNNQSGYPGQLLTDPLSARVVDSRGKILKNYPIFYDVVSGGGSLQSNYLTSDNTGITNNKWQLGISGNQTSRAYLKKANREIINRSILNFNATVSSTSLPTLTTTDITNITQTTATGGGNVTDDGGATVTARGVCWSSSPNPTIYNSRTTTGTGTGRFTSNLTDLSASTPYYVRAYASNIHGTAYGNEVTFITEQTITKPTLTTNQIIDITQTTATGGGNVTDDGGATVTARGICWSTSSNPTTANSKTNNGTGTGSFTSSLNGLTPKTPYYVRAYATNSKGTAYGSQISFETSSESEVISITPSNSCATAPVMDVNTTYSVKINVSDYTTGTPIEGESYGGANIRGFWLAFKIPGNWTADHDVKIFNVSNNFNPVFGIKGNCIGNYLGNRPNMAGFVNKNGYGGNETSDTNLPGSENYGDADNTYYIRIYHYKGSETPSITFDVVVE